MEAILQSWQRTLRFLLILVSLMLILWICISNLFDTLNFNVEMGEDKTLINIIDNKQVVAQSLLSASDCWVKTGIEIRSNESYEIKISGKINVAGVKMFQEAEVNAIPTFTWTDYNGREFKIRNDEAHLESDSLKRRLLLKENENIGCVLLYFQEEGSETPSCDMNDFNPTPRTSKIFVYGKDEEARRGRNAGKKKWYIWACVNDLIIKDTSESTKKAFLGAYKSQEIFDQKLANWEAIKSQKYYRVWYDDNIGNFVLSAIIQKNRKSIFN